jgi:hypothetical protein
MTRSISATILLVCLLTLICTASIAAASASIHDPVAKAAWHAQQKQQHASDQADDQRIRPYLSSAAGLPPEVYYPANIAYQGEYDDGSWGPFPIGFDFPFFDSTYTEFYVTSNGYIAFDSVGFEINAGEGWSEYGNSCIPDAGTPNGYIAAFWNDVIIHDNGGVIYYQLIGDAPNRKLVVQCTNMGQFGEPTLLGTFSFVLYETSNEIQVQYRIIVDNASDWAHGQEATIGLESGDGSQGVQYSCYEISLQSEQALRFVPDGMGSYTLDSSALYDGILLGDGNPPSIPGLVTPAQGAVVSLSPVFEWTPCDYTTSYEFRLATVSDLSDAEVTDVELATSYIPTTPLDPGMTYYWAVFAVGDDGITWSEIRMIETSLNPPPTGTPQTVWTTLGAAPILTLGGTGGEGTLTRTITALPLNGELYQYDAGDRGPEITTVPTEVTDANAQVIFTIDDGIIGTNRGNFEFTVTDTNGWESDPVMVTINVYPAPTVVTSSLVVTGLTTATGGGEVTADGGSAVTNRGLCWGIAPNPTTAGTFTSDGTDLGTYTSDLIDLVSGTLYYYRAYAQNSSGIGYGNQFSFYAGYATVTTDDADSITATGAFCGGNVTTDGGSIITERGICFSVDPTPTIADATAEHLSADTGAFNLYLKGLDPSTTYRARAYATNAAGTAYGSEISFTTLAQTGFTISGYILDGSSDGVDSVVMDGLPHDPMTDSTGFYADTVPANWSGTVIPTRSSFVFTPDSVVYDSVDADMTDEDYLGVSILSGIDPNGQSTPHDFALRQNRPNPFNPSTEIQYSLAVGSDVKLEIYNLTGQCVATLVDQHQSAGSHTAIWTADNFASGVYLYRLTADKFTETRKMLLVK